MSNETDTIGQSLSNYLDSEAVQNGRIAACIECGALVTGHNPRGPHGPEFTRCSVAQRRLERQYGSDCSGGVPRVGLRTKTWARHVESVKARLWWALALKVARERGDMEYVHAHWYAHEYAIKAAQQAA